MGCYRICTWRTYHIPHIRRKGMERTRHDDILSVRGFRLCDIRLASGRVGRFGRMVGQWLRFVLAWQSGLGVCRDGTRFPADNDCRIPRVGIRADTQHDAGAEGAGQEIPGMGVSGVCNMCAGVLHSGDILRRYDQLHCGRYMAFLDDSSMGRRIL